MFPESGKKTPQNYRSTTVKCHLLQKRSALFWNKVRDVESGVATNACWMATQQWLYRGKEGWKEQIITKENKESLVERKMKGQINQHPLSKKKKKVNVRARAAGKQEETQEAEHLKKHWSHWLQPGCDSTTVAILWNCNVYRKDGTFYIPVRAGNFTERAQNPQGIGTFTEKQRNYARSERSEHKSNKCFSNPAMLPYCYNNWQ